MAKDLNGSYLPDPSLFKDAYISSLEQYKKLYQESVTDCRNFWDKQAHELLHWEHDFSFVSDSDFSEGLISWFLGGKLNACENCVDRHVKRKEIRWPLSGSRMNPGHEQRITYSELQRMSRVWQMSLRHNGIRKGDRVAIYMPMIPEAVYAMLACARIGAVHSVVFAGFSAESLRDRINDARCKAVITADEGVRGKKIIPLKRTVDEATMACPTC